MSIEGISRIYINIFNPITLSEYVTKYNFYIHESNNKCDVKVSEINFSFDVSISGSTRKYFMACCTRFDR